MKEELDRHIDLKRKQQEKIDRIADAYKQGTLQQFCAS